MDSFIILGGHVTLHCSLSLSLYREYSPPLYISCLKGNVEMVQLLVHHHAAIDQPCDVSNTLYNSTSLSLFSVYCSLYSRHTQCHSHLHYYHVHHRVSMLLLH